MPGSGRRMRRGVGPSQVQRWASGFAVTVQFVVVWAGGPGVRVSSSNKGMLICRVIRKPCAWLSGRSTPTHSATASKTACNDGGRNTRREPCKQLTP